MRSVLFPDKSDIPSLSSGYLIQHIFLSGTLDDSNTSFYGLQKNINKNYVIYNKKKIVLLCQVGLLGGGFQNEEGSRGHCCIVSQGVLPREIEERRYWSSETKL